jgi:hypothetical protein
MLHRVKGKCMAYQIRQKQLITSHKISKIKPGKGEAKKKMLKTEDQTQNSCISMYALIFDNMTGCF